MSDTMIRLDRISRKFGELTAVRSLSLEIARGEIFGLVGPDGAGKTTTLRMLCGLIDPSEGKAEIGGLEVATHTDQVKDQIGYMAQRFGLYGDLTVEENMLFYSDLFDVRGKERDQLMGQLLEMTRMAPFRDRFASKLSGGMKQKLALMCTLLHHPKVLLLDEPTNGVDPLSRRDFWTILYQLAKDGMTILVSTAYLDEAERCDRVGLLHQGQLIHCDTPKNLRQQLRPSCFAVRSGDLRRIRAEAQTVPSVDGAEPAGAALHIYLDPEQTSADQVASQLKERGLPDVHLEPMDPSLEDVFIALIRREERHARG